MTSKSEFLSETYDLRSLRLVFNSSDKLSTSTNSAARTGMHTFQGQFRGSNNHKDLSLSTQMLSHQLLRLIRALLEDKTPRTPHLPFPPPVTTRVFSKIPRTGTRLGLNRRLSQLREPNFCRIRKLPKSRTRARRLSPVSRDAPVDCPAADAAIRHSGRRNPDVGDVGPSHPLGMRVSVQHLPADTPREDAGGPNRGSHRNKHPHRPPRRAIPDKAAVTRRSRRPRLLRTLHIERNLFRFVTSSSPVFGARLPHPGAR
ncbi:hypothetical protein H6P81_011730 [Aristolochia fimbriata]|uniref:Uncharacterized protein n=1 Tax=Aristolochia fimbriata TaxID=158543 RepID=A0AAV7EDL7_ARIFI|nr:hypothetical protein H6P81_011730 [Aristolochia fimbriata]